MRLVPIFLLCVAVGRPASSADAPKPFVGESLQYSVNWPSGLSLGEAELGAGKAAEGYRFTFRFDASVPGFRIATDGSSLASSNFCGVELQKKWTHGASVSEETTRFDDSERKAVRETKKGGKTDLSVPACAKDALTFLYFTRRELAQGRLPTQQTVLYGAPYQVYLRFAGRETIQSGGGAVEADRIQASIKGPKSDIDAQIYFAHDAARTPLLVKVPLSMGTFTMELIR